MYGREKKAALKILACPAKSDSVMLRWAPADRESWKLGNRYGYIVERYTLIHDGQYVPKPVARQLTPHPLLPKSEILWQVHADRNKYAAIAHECIFGAASDIPSGPVGVYRRYQEEQNKYAFALYAADRSPLTARLSGLWFTDRMVAPTDKYVYTVRVAAPDSVGSDTAFVFTGLQEYKALPEPGTLKAGWGDRKVMLSWNAFFLNTTYTGYVVERSSDGKHFESLSDNSTVQLTDSGVNPELMFRTDTFPDNIHTWYYRIRGNTSFGETGPAGNVVTGHGRLTLQEAPAWALKEVLANRYVRLAWTFPTEKNECIAGFRVYRSDKPGGSKQLIFESKNKNLREFIDKSPQSTNYYLVSAYDSETEKISANETFAGLVDTTPPPSPVSLTGRVDSAGVVYLRWNAANAPDVDGYRVFYSNHPEHEFMAVDGTITKDTFFVDTINVNTLSRKIWYRVRAIDKVGNQSDFSSMLKLTRPDNNPPVTPVLQTAVARKDGVELKWINSTSEDVVSHLLFRVRRADGATDTIVFNRDGKSVGTYIDRTVANGETYSYSVQAIDESGLHSEMSAPVLACADAGDVSSVMKINALACEKGVMLRWSCTARRTLERVLIYRSVDGQSPRLLTSVVGDSFTDVDVRFGHTFTYRIRAVFTDGTTSAFSQGADIKL